MAIHIVQIDRYRFVCGLFWQSLSRRHELRAEAIELAKKLNFDAMVLRIDRSFAGAGFASTREGAQLGLPSLGALVSKAIATEGAFYDGRQQPAPNWLGAFSLPDGRWAYFAVRDGAFLPHGDWVGSPEEVLERLHSDYSLGGWNVVIGDARIESQGFHNFYPRKIEDVIPRRAGKPHVPRWLRLAPVTRRVPWRRLAFVGSALLGVGLVAGALMVDREHRLAAARELAMQRVREELARRPPAALAKPAPAVHPWAGAPLPATFVGACLDRLALWAPGGWQLDQYICRSTVVSYSWARNDSTVAMLLASQPAAEIDPTGDHASLALPLAMPAGGDEALGHREVRLRLLAVFQLLGIPLRLTLQPVPAAPKSEASSPLMHLGAKPAPAPVPDWKTWRFSAALGDTSPRNVADFLRAAGVRLDKLSYQAGQWTLEGFVYEQ